MMHILLLSRGTAAWLLAKASRFARYESSVFSVGMPRSSATPPPPPPLHSLACLVWWRVKLQMQFEEHPSKAFSHKWQVYSPGARWRGTLSLSRPTCHMKARPCRRPKQLIRVQRRFDQPLVKSVQHTERTRAPPLVLSARCGTRS